MGLKHNVVGQIYAFRQKDGETVRECISRLKQYISRCPIAEKPNEKRLISIFLEGLRNREMYAFLYTQKHSSLNDCCTDAMDYDDNMYLSSASSKDQKKPKDEAETSSSANDVAKIVGIVVEKLGHMLPASQNQNHYQTQTYGPNAANGIPRA